MKRQTVPVLVLPALLVLTSAFLRATSAGPVLEEQHRINAEKLTFDATECVETGPACVKSCHQMADGDYQWCGGCSVYASCRSHDLQLVACARLLELSVWDDQLKRCAKSSHTCHCHRTHDYKKSQATTDSPTASPTKAATEAPIKTSTKYVTVKPTEAPTQAPTKTPTEKPSEKTTETPTETISSTTLETTIAPNETTSTTIQTTIAPNETTSTTIQTTIAPNETTSTTIQTTIAPNETTSTTIPTTIAPNETTSTTIPTTIAPNETTSTTIQTTIAPNETTSTTIPTTIAPNETTSTTIQTTIAPNETTSTTIQTTIAPNETTPSPTTMYTTINATTTTSSPTTIETTTNGPTTTINPADRDQYRSGTVYINPWTHKLTYKLGKIDRKKGAAYGFYNNTIHSTGWGVLEIRTRPPYIRHKQIGSEEVAKRMYAAGFLEGLLTARQIWNHYVNVRSFFLPPGDDETEEAVKKFFLEQHKWAWEMVEAQQKRKDPYWTNVRYILEQLQGLHAGYKIVAKKEGWETDLFVVQLLNALGDLLDLKAALKRPSERPNPMEMTRRELSDYVARNSRCSALIKLTAGFENIFIGHSTWFIYASTLRIYKYYYFDYFDFKSHTHTFSFSSYPGALVSIDEFYLLDSRLAMIQTTNNIFNQSLYDLVTPESLFAWQRVFLANRMARNGRCWFEIFQQFNSGTYNNQYMVIDLSKFKPNEDVKDGALWVIEQVPGQVVGADQTNLLRLGYWPSYNIPFYEEIYRLSGYAEIAKIFGQHYSYQLTPRAKIFRRDSGQIHNLTAFQDLLRYNGYKTDEYSEGSPSLTICSRDDLDSAHPVANGCYDTKVTDYNMTMKLVSLALSGPTTSHALPVFSWTGTFQNISHVGLPGQYNFDWIAMSPSLD